MKNIFGFFFILSLSTWPPELEGTTLAAGAVQNLRFNVSCGGKPILQTAYFQDENFIYYRFPRILIKQDVGFTNLIIKEFDLSDHCGQLYAVVNGSIGPVYFFPHKNISVIVQFFDVCEPMYRQFDNIMLVNYNLLGCH